MTQIYSALMWHFLFDALRDWTPVYVNGVFVPAFMVDRRK